MSWPAVLHLSPAGRGRFRRSRNRVRGHRRYEGRKVLSIISITPSMFSYTSVFVTRTTRNPKDSNTRVRSISRLISCDVECVAPSTSTISFPSIVTKSTTCRSIGCCRRNFHRANRRARNTCQRLDSALVCESRSLRALFLKRSIPLTRPPSLCCGGRPLPAGERCNTGRWADHLGGKL